MNSKIFGISPPPQNIFQSCAIFFSLSQADFEISTEIRPLLEFSSEYGQS